MWASARKSGPSRRRSTASSGEKSPIGDLIQNPHLGRRRRHLVKVRTLLVDAPCRRYSRRGSRPIGAEKSNLVPCPDSIQQGRVRIMSDAPGTARVKDAGGRGRLR